MQKTQVKTKKYGYTDNIKMKRNKELKKICIKNHTCYCSDDLIKIKQLYFVNVLLDKKLYENIFICEASHQILIAAKCLRIMFNKVDGFLRDFVETKEISDDDFVLEKN